MRDDKIVEMSWCVPPQVTCPAHQMMLRTALINEAQSESYFHRVWYQVAGKVGHYRKGLTTVGVAMVFMVAVDGMGRADWGRWQRPSSQPSVITAEVKEKILARMDDLETKDRELIEKRTGMSLAQVRDEVSEAEIIRMLGTHRLSPQVIWGLASEPHFARVSGVYAAESATREATPRPSVGDYAQGVELTVIEYKVEGETKHMGLTSGYLPLVVWDE